jgi:hypothetical protein
MKTKLFSFLLIFLFSNSLIKAQDDPKVGFGIIGGLNLQTITGKDYYGEKIDNGLVFGFHAGINANIHIASDYYFQPGLLFTTKGGKAFVEEQATKSDPDEITKIVKLNYIEMPLNFLYRPVLGEGHMLLGFGPYLALGIGGKGTSEGGYQGDYDFDVKFKNPGDWDSENPTEYYRPFDAGANIFFGYEMSAGLFFQLNAQLGMLKVNSEYEGMDTDDTNLKNTGFGLSIGYRF